MRAVAIAVCSIVAVVACGGHPHPNKPAPVFDAKRLAAELDHALEDMAAVVVAANGDCVRIVNGLGDAVDRARRPIDDARRARLDPDHAQQLKTELDAYKDVAARKGEAIGGMLGVCFREHHELQPQIQHVVDSLPTL
jgi:hypothetical protein